MKKIMNISINEDVLRAIDENSALCGMNRSQFVDLVMGSACGVYKASSILPNMLGACMDSQKSPQGEPDILTA